MLKPPEEGEFWEWRAFGTLGADLKATIKGYPIRDGIDGVSGDDVYFISPDSDQNVKLRRTPSYTLLKFKLLLESRGPSIELYRETRDLIFTFPVPSRLLHEAARLLETKLPADVTDQAVNDEQFTLALYRSSPPIPAVLVKKVRSQFAFDRGWFELARASFPARTVDSLSINSAEFTVVESMLELVDPGPELEPINYVKACRRWGSL